MTGTVTCTKRTFGFITPDNSDQDVFFAFNALHDPPIGTRVEFHISRDHDGRTLAANLRVIDGAPK